MNNSALLLLLISFTTLAEASSTIDDPHSTNPPQGNPGKIVDYVASLEWDSNYISEGRNNLDKGGIFWSSIISHHENLTLYAIAGRADSMQYSEWNLGFEYTVSLKANLEMNLGYQNIQSYGDERFSDNELFSSLTYAGIEWLTPSLNYVYSLEARGYFIEAALHSSWHVSDALTVTPYIAQAFDFKYVTEEHNGKNHFQFGIEAEYQYNQKLVLSGHISHTLAQEDIKLEADLGTLESSLDHSFSGITLTWLF
ncbi:hypothetical protein [Shewanella woodyi]|uniref:hypothetical protein n=1 Tax=Shewanella woodyi TaxID=60961 RepID=UPI0007F9040D|nr:hypothetical protein [Shewanella woodyi]